MTTNRFISLLIIIILGCAESLAQYNSFVRSFSRNDFPLSGPTWSISPADGGFVFFANGDNVVQQSHGQLTALPFRTEVRSVKASRTHSCLFAGGISEFGFFRPQANGELQYTSLSDSLDESMRTQLGNIWTILENDNVVYFVTDGIIIKYLGGQYTTIRSPFHVNASAFVGGLLYLAVDNGLYCLRDSELRRCPNTDITNSFLIRGLVPYSDGMLLITQKNGLYYYDGIRCEPFATQADKFLMQNEIFCTSCGGGQIALGTIKGGIVLMDIKTRGARYINESNGLKNNTVISLSFDAEGNLWTGLDNGIDHVFINSGIKNLYSYPNFYGAGYDACVMDGTLYLATNRGLFHTPWPVSAEKNIPITEVPNSGGQVWKLFKFGSQLICLHDHGLFKVNGHRLEPISEIQGFWGICQLTDRKLLAATYSDLYFIDQTDGGQFQVTGVGNLQGSFHNMVCTGGDTIWLHSHNTPLVHMAIFSRISNTISSVRELGRADGVPDDRHLSISAIHGNIYIASISGIFRYNSQSRKFEPCADIDGIPGGRPYCSISADSGYIAALSPGGITFSCPDGHSRTYTFTPDFIDPEPLQNQIHCLQGPLFVIPNINGFAIADTRSAGGADSMQSRIINSVFISSLGDSLIYKDNFLNLRNNPVIDYDNANLRFVYSHSQMGVMYQYRLNESEPWSEPSQAPGKEFTEIKEGSYKFEVRSIHNGMATGGDTFSFRVLSPWYRTAWAYCIWAIMLVLTVMLIKNLVHRHINKVRSAMEAQKKEDLRKRDMEHERENAKKEQQIIAMEKEKLENELNHKTQELAGMLINVAGKNEILQELKTDIKSIMEDVQGAGIRQKLLSLNSKIDSNIQNDNIIDRFEKQFDLLHNNFMHRLQEENPQLSKNERLLCAYIHMELNTKEIAQLLNISVRGVETMRYRLKKKICADRSIDLDCYLKSLEKKQQ